MIYSDMLSLAMNRSQIIAQNNDDPVNWLVYV